MVHLMKEANDYLIILFVGLILPAFTGNYPETDVRQIFDYFILEGVEAIENVLMKMMMMKKDKLLTLGDADLH